MIIDEADAAGAEAQSALLKTLEEPPSASVFILVSSMPDALLPTVLSRCPAFVSDRSRRPRSPTVLMRDHGYPKARRASRRLMRMAASAARSNPVR